MKKYLIDFHYGVSCKNKLEEEISEFARSYHRVWISESEFKSTLNVISDYIAKLHLKHHRCAQCKVNVYDYKDLYSSGDVCVSFGGNVFCKLQFLAFEVK